LGDEHRSSTLPPRRPHRDHGRHPWHRPGRGRGLHASGARLVVSSRKVDACRQTEEELTALGYDVVGVPCHMGSMDDIRALVAATVDRFGGIDVVVNNAANALAEPIGAFTEDGFAKSVDVNIKGPVFLVQEALPHLETSAHASIINVVSAGAWLYSSNVAMYAAAKSAMVSYTKTMAAGLMGQGVRVNALAQGRSTRTTEQHRPGCRRDDGQGVC
jgi:NAD(P)-dependent dehydrogenase (short-subunit alcohol dehydrogenase family)